jgi:nucleoside-diphosphate-sugar epimerase
VKNILLIGGFGFTGVHLINKIEGRCEKIVVYSTHNNDRYRIIKNPTNIIYEQGDVSDPSHLDNVIQNYKPEVIVHLAALTGIKKCQDNPQRSFLVNVYGTYNVVMSAVKSKSRLIFLSSREVYGETSNSTTLEDDPKIPNNVYGLTKLTAENFILWAHKRHGLPYTIVRPTNLYGPSGDEYGAQVIIKKFLNNEKIPILGGNQRMNFIHVEDVASAIQEIIFNERSLLEAFNVGSSYDLTVNEFVGLLTKITGKNPPLEYLPMREAETLNFRVSSDKIKKILGWSPKIDIEEGLSDTINWYKDQIKK